VFNYSIGEKFHTFSAVFSARRLKEEKMATLTTRAPERVQPLGDHAKWLPLLITLAVGLAIWFIPPPEGVDIKAWHLLAIFVATIVGIIVKPLPMGAVALIGIMATALTGTLSIGDALSGFNNTTIWLIVAAFFISRGFIKTGLGERIAYYFMSMLGKRTLGLAYGLIGTDLVLAPAIPSNTARGGGIVYPVLLSLAKAYGSEPDDGTANKMGAFLVRATFQGSSSPAPCSSPRWRPTRWRSSSPRRRAWRSPGPAGPLRPVCLADQPHRRALHPLPAQPAGDQGHAGSGGDGQGQAELHGRR
jgi:hypothetical protein